MIKLFLVGLGGCIGSIARYAVSGWAHRWFGASFFPIGTLTVNCVGCLLIGLVGALGEGRISLSPEVRLFVMMGMFGGFTTYSSFGYETLALLRDGERAWALANVGLHLVVGLGAVWLGMTLARLLDAGA